MFCRSVISKAGVGLTIIDKDCKQLSVNYIYLSFVNMIVRLVNQGGCA